MRIRIRQFFHNADPEHICPFSAGVGDYVLVTNDLSTDNFLSYEVAKIER